MSKQTESFYNRLSPFYPLIDIFLRPQKNVLFKEINTLPHGQLLEIGVGTGAHLHMYKRHKVTGIDTALHMLAVAEKRKNKNAELFQMNGEALSFADSSFDYVVLSHVIAVVDHPEKVLNEVFRVLKPKGRVFILNHFTPDNWLKHIDSTIRMISKLLHFNSLFYVHDLEVPGNLSLLKQMNLGPLSYFKLLIYEKK